ncbi:MAG: NUDIX domain-containing protein [Candidatus Brockarchaeota archaeon]|nr:NUDIX domain-containing protein [Candidatus Brockarchaeota archaeon]
MPKEISAGAVVFRQDETRQYLLLHYESGHWDFPKGNVERGEKAETTARREVEEETGIRDVVFVPGFEQRIRYFYKRGGRTVCKEVVYLLAETKTKEVKLSSEHVGFDWLDFKGAYERVTFRSSKGVLERAEKHLSALKR